MERTLYARPALITGLILLIPAVMTFIDRNKAIGEGWAWGPMDFVIMGALVFGAGLAYEFFARRIEPGGKRFALAALVIVAVLVIWVELAVNAVSQLIRFLFA